MKKCKTCGNELTGLQRKFCSRKCLSKDTNHRHQNYFAQQARGKKRRIDLIRIKGGECQECGYKKNQASLVFHHRDPSEKLFGVDIRKCSNAKWDRLVEEVEKCDLVCQNCHGEIHHPELTIE